MEEEITRTTNKIDRTTIDLNVNIDKEHIVMLSNNWGYWLLKKLPKFIWGKTYRDTENEIK